MSNQDKSKSILDQAKLVLDMKAGDDSYKQAMGTILARIVKEFPESGDPRKVANLMITETYKYTLALLPGLNLLECSTLFGAVIGLGLSGYIVDGRLSESEVPQLVEAYTASIKNTLPAGKVIVQKAMNEAKLQAASKKPKS